MIAIGLWLYFVLYSSISYVASELSAGGKHVFFCFHRLLKQEWHCHCLVATILYVSNEHFSDFC